MWGLLLLNSSLAHSGCSFSVVEGHGIHLTAEEEEQINKTPENSALSGDLFRAVRSGEAPIQGIGLPSHSRNLATMSPRQGTVVFVLSPPVSFHSPRGCPQVSVPWHLYVVIVNAPPL